MDYPGGRSNSAHSNTAQPSSKFTQFTNFQNNPPQTPTYTEKVDYSAFQNNEPQTSTFTERTEYSNFQKNAPQTPAEIAEYETVYGNDEPTLNEYTGRQSNEHQAQAPAIVDRPQYKAHKNVQHHAPTHIARPQYKAHSNKQHHTTPTHIERSQPIVAQPQPTSEFKFTGSPQADIQKSINTQTQQSIAKPKQKANQFKETDEERYARERHQAESAHYSFDSNINDEINDHAISRQETRDGLALHGMYSYSDGFFKRTIHYEADENGYRVVK